MADSETCQHQTGTYMQDDSKQITYCAKCGMEWQ